MSTETPSERAGLSLELCGSLRLVVDGRRRERELPGRLGRLLLAYLALNRRRTVTRDELTEALWATGAPSDASRTLSTLVSGTRRCVGRDVLVGRQELRLVLPEPAAIDVERATTAIARAREALAVDRPEFAATSAEIAAAILERPLLADHDAPWLAERRRELEECGHDALELVAHAALALGDAALPRALEAARRLVERAPFRERGWALLMEVEAARGNVAEALRVFERLRRLMREELGAAPSAELRELHARLLAHGTPAAPLPAPLARAAGRPLVGREDELALLELQLTAGGRRFAFLTGEPGIGKTSLAAALAARLQERATVLYGRCTEEPLAPYGPFAEMLGGRSPPPGGDRLRHLAALTAALSAAAGARPLLLVLDDLHWADAGTLQLLAHLGRADTRETLLVVGSFRDAEAPPGSRLATVVDDLRAGHAAVTVPLRGLDAAATDRLVAATAPALGPDAARDLLEATGGNPLFLVELLRSRAEGDLGIPGGVRAVILRRVARLGDDARDVLTRAAVAGQTFGVATLGLDPEAAAAALDRAVTAGLLVPGRRPGELSFSHALVRETLYEEAGAARRAVLHLEVARALERHRPAPAELAHHFFAARELAGPEPAVRHGREAARRAMAGFAWEDAARELERALEADRLREPPDLDERTELLLELGEAHLRAGHGAAREPFAEAARLARGRSPTQLARAAVGYGGRYFEAGLVDESLIEMLEGALRELPAHEGALRARVLARLAESLHFAGRPETAVALSEEALAAARESGDDEVLLAALIGRHTAMLHVAYAAERLAASTELVTLARRTGNAEAEMRGLHARAFDRLTVGDTAGARRDCERLSDLAREHRQPLFVHLALAWRGTFAQLDGQFAEAQRLASEAFALRERLATRDAEAVFAGQLFTIRRAQGRLHELLPIATQVSAEVPGLAVWRAALPLVHLAAGDEATARRELAALLDELDSVPPDFFWLTHVAALAEAAAGLREPAAARRLHDLLAPYATRFVQVGHAAPFGPVAPLLDALAAVAPVTGEGGTGRAAGRRG